MGPKSGPVKEPAEQIVKEIRRATRRQFPAEEKLCTSMTAEELRFPLSSVAPDMIPSLDQPVRGRLVPGAL